jgi:hypothetical protein
MQRITSLAFSSLLIILGFLPRAAEAQSDNRAWNTYLHAASCADLICLNDTVWMATGEAGLLRYVRSTRTWASITREPSGLAGNTILSPHSTRAAGCSPARRARASAGSTPTAAGRSSTSSTGCRRTARW